MTRYPRGGKGRKWTTLELKGIPPEWQGDKLSDSEGLTGTVRVSSDRSVSVRYQYIFKWQGKPKWHQCGTWPTVSMESIREQRDRARVCVKTGINPNDQKRADRIEAQDKVEALIQEAKRKDAENLTFSEMFNAWVKNGVARADGNAELFRAFNKDILPPIGDLSVRSLSENDLLEALRAVGRERGKGRTAEILLADLRQLFRWAEKRQPWRGLLVEGNPAELVELKQVVDPTYSDAPRTRMLSAAELNELQNTLKELEADYKNAKNRRSAPRPVIQETQIALWLCLSTLCRIGELLMARWEHIDFETGEWTVPAENTKTKQQWDVCLSPFALKQFKALHQLTGETPWCFPAKNTDNSHVCVKSVTKQMGDRQSSVKDTTKPMKHRRQDDTLVLAKGIHGKWTPHDLRRTGATQMQRMGVLPVVIDSCLNHVLPGGKVRLTYQLHEYADEMKAAWIALGSHLETTLGQYPQHSSSD